MAVPVLVAKKYLGHAGTNSTTTIPLTSGWNTTYGSATYAPVANDVVIVTYSVGSSADDAIGVTTAGYTEEAELYANDGVDANLSVSWKRMGSTPDTEVIVSGTGGAQNAGAVVVEVWSGVNTATAIDVTTTTATGIDGGRPDPPSITPITTDAMIIVCAAAAAGIGLAFTQSGSELSNFLSGSSADTNDAMVGTGNKAWTGGAFDPVAWTGGSSGLSDSWAAATLALRPFVATPSLCRDRLAYIRPFLAR